MLHCAGCKVASVVSEVQLTAGDWEVDGKQVGNWTSYIPLVNAQIYEYLWNQVPDGIKMSTRGYLFLWLDSEVQLVLWKLKCNGWVTGSMNCSDLYSNCLVWHNSH